MEFFASVVLCGFVEYFTSLYLEISCGRRWWNYNGYFLNLNGRICAEGLLVFGLGGVAIVYIIAPLLDNFFRKIKLRVVGAVCAALIVAFIVDMVYSKKNPNTGKGISTFNDNTPEYMLAEMYQGQRTGMRIEYLLIRNFKSIRELEINDIEDVLILVGRNNAGKECGS